MKLVSMANAVTARNTPSTCIVLSILKLLDINMIYNDNNNNNLPLPQQYPDPLEIAPSQCLPSWYKVD